MKNISKTKIKTQDNKINANFHKNVVPEEGCHCVCLSIVSIDRVLGWVKTIIRKYFRKKKYLVKENKMNKFINKE